MSKDLCRTLGANIRGRREAKNLTLADLAEVLSVSYQQVQKYEKGVNRMSCDKLVTLALLFRCSMDELCGIKYRQVTPEEGELLATIIRLNSVTLRRLATDILIAIAKWDDPPIHFEAQISS